MYGGGMGQAGQGLVRQVEDGTVLALSREHADLADANAVKEALDKYDPTVVINAAVFHPVDLCETEFRQSFAINSLGPGVLAAACERRDIRLIHLSTDYVFGGDQEHQRGTEGGFGYVPHGRTARFVDDQGMPPARHRVLAARAPL